MWKAVLLIWVVMVLRSFVSQSFMAFVPVLYAREGYPLVSIGLIISLFTVSGALSGLIAGHLSDRIGYKPIFYVAFSLSPPCLLLMLFASGVWSYVGAGLAGFFLHASLPLGLVMAQKLAPRGKSMVSSLMMGLSMGLGGDDDAAGRQPGRGLFHPRRPLRFGPPVPGDDRPRPVLPGGAPPGAPPRRLRPPDSP
jgi:FSR family fosmidomycin resistance protein-like MFS transporter